MIIRKVTGPEQFTSMAGTDIPYNDIGCVNWPERYPYKPSVRFAVAHNGDKIFIRYEVSEQCSMALTAEDNGPVWTDSCVEFFISLDDSGYYNFEFNCAGTALLGFRKEREVYTHAGPEIMKLIGRSPSLGRGTFPETGPAEWSLMVTLPKEVFFKHNIHSLDGLKARANFYKCGDNLSRVHFLSWRPIDNPTPDFHKEEFFGEVEFGC